VACFPGGCADGPPVPKTDERSWTHCYGYDFARIREALRFIAETDPAFAFDLTEALIRVKITAELYVGSRELGSGRLRSDKPDVNSTAGPIRLYISRRSTPPDATSLGGLT
jgi:hypothetical protein